MLYHECLINVPFLFFFFFVTGNLTYTLRIQRHLLYPLCAIGKLRIDTTKFGKETKEQVANTFGNTLFQHAMLYYTFLCEYDPNNEHA